VSAESPLPTYDLSIRFIAHPSQSTQFAAECAVL
jgi:hypothetical protein